MSGKEKEKETRLEVSFPPFLIRVDRKEDNRRRQIYTRSGRVVIDFNESEGPFRPSKDSEDWDEDLKDIRDLINAVARDSVKNVPGTRSRYTRLSFSKRMKTEWACRPEISLAVSFTKPSLIMSQELMLKVLLRVGMVALPYLHAARISERNQHWRRERVRCGSQVLRNEVCRFLKAAYEEARKEAEEALKIDKKLEAINKEMASKVRKILTKWMSSSKFEGRGGQLFSSLEEFLDKEWGLHNFSIEMITQVLLKNAPKRAAFKGPMFFDEGTLKEGEARDWFTKLCKQEERGERKKCKLILDT